MDPRQRIFSNTILGVATSTLASIKDDYYKKQLERYSIMARIVAIVTYKLTLLSVLVQTKFVSVAKFAVYFHRKEFRRKKPLPSAFFP